VKRKNSTAKNTAGGNEAGFTLIEIMVVVVLIGVMAAIAVPSLRTWLPKHQLRGSRSNMVGAFQMGKMRAIAVGHNFYVDFDPDGDGSTSEGYLTCYLDTDDDGGGGDTNNSAGDNEFKESQVAMPDANGLVPAIKLQGRIVYGVDSGVTAAPNSAAVGDGVAVDDDRIEFRPSGRITLNNDGTLPTIYLRTGKGENKAIQVNMLGQVTEYTWNGSGWEQ